VSPRRSIHLWSVALVVAGLLHVALAWGLAAHSWARTRSPLESMDVVLVREGPVERRPEPPPRETPRPAPSRVAPRPTPPPPPPPIVTEPPVAPAPPPEMARRPEPVAETPAPRPMPVDTTPPATPSAPSPTPEKAPDSTGRSSHVGVEGKSPYAVDPAAGASRGGSGGPPAVASLPRGDAGPPSGAGPSTGTSTRGITQWARPQGGYQVVPTYPSTARRLGIQGTTRLRVQVLADGRVGEIVVEASAGHPDLDRAATDAVRQWHFEPARKGTESVVSWVLLPVQFELKR